MKHGWIAKVFLLAAILAGCVILVKHESDQTKTLESLQEQVFAQERMLQSQLALIHAQEDLLQTLQTKIQTVSDSKSPASAFTDKVGTGFDYLAIGNSITLHPVTDYWWSECGMAASTPENDYYHEVVRGLEDRYGEVNAAALNYSAWETQAHDRSETYTLLEEWLTEGIDLVTVQLGENVADDTTFSVDLVSLILLIQEYCGQSCRIVVIDNFYDFHNNDLHDIKNMACERLGIGFVDLNDIRGKEEYQVGMGSVIFGEDGKEHQVEHAGVAVHPGDAGMVVIASRIIAIID